MGVADGGRRDAGIRGGAGAYVPQARGTRLTYSALPFRTLMPLQPPGLFLRMTQSIPEQGKCCSGILLLLYPVHDSINKRL
jgi:hypothetical protein